MTAQSHSWGQSWLAREDYRTLRQVEREVYPTVTEMLAERTRAVPRPKKNDEPAAPPSGAEAAGSPKETVHHG